MRRRNIVMLIISIVLFFAFQNTPLTSRIALHSTTDLYAVRVLNATTVYVGQPVKIYNIIVNSGTWTLHNITFDFSISPSGNATVSDIKIVDIINESEVKTEITFGTESIYISVFIEKISMKTTFKHWIVVEFKSPGNYSVLTEKPISLTRTKGELKEEVTDLGINDASIEVRRAPKLYPPEGTKNVFWLIFLVTVIAPIATILLSNRIIGATK